MTQQRPDELEAASILDSPSDAWSTAFLRRRAELLEWRAAAERFLYNPGHVLPRSATAGAIATQCEIPLPEIGHVLRADRFRRHTKTGQVLWTLARPWRRDL